MYACNMISFLYSAIYKQTCMIQEALHKAQSLEFAKAPQALYHIAIHNLHEEHGGLLPPKMQEGSIPCSRVGEAQQGLP